MNKIRDVDYLYATARLRALEKNMMTGRDMEKMLDAATLEESYKVANDISLHSRGGVKEYERAIGDMLADAYALVDELAGKEGAPVFRVFRLKYDGHNLKTIIKSQALGGDPLPAMSALGIVPKEELLAAWNEKKLPDTLPAALNAAALAASEKLAKAGDPQAVDTLVDMAVMEGMLEMAEGIGFAFLTRVVRCTIDVENLRTAVRLKRMGRDLERLKKLTVPGGTIPPDRLWAAFGPAGFEAMKDMLFITDYYGHFAPLLENLDMHKPLTAFERGADNYLLSLIKSARLVAFGLEPLIGFILAKENEAKNIRIVLASKAAGVPREKISERLRETYA